ncbi:hypothetical protein F5B20DRAFT_593688 [Whalleya microplaca]|nr:hypothetical protein F5B20DRAFT_593688 [Whalleya microplaca]
MAQDSIKIPPQEGFLIHQKDLTGPAMLALTNGRKADVHLDVTIKENLEKLLTTAVAYKDEWSNMNKVDTFLMAIGKDLGIESAGVVKHLLTILVTGRRRYAKFNPDCRTDKSITPLAKLVDELSQRDAMFHNGNPFNIFNFTTTKRHGGGDKDSLEESVKRRRTEELNQTAGDSGKEEMRELLSTMKQLQKNHEEGMKQLQEDHEEGMKKLRKHFGKAKMELSSHMEYHILGAQQDITTSHQESILAAQGAIIGSHQMDMVAAEEAIVSRFQVDVDEPEEFDDDGEAEDRYIKDEETDEPNLMAGLEAYIREED